MTENETILESLRKIYKKGKADAKKEINEIMDMDLPISNILFEIDNWLKEQTKW